MGRAIVRDPQVFLFDEPLSNLDAKLRVPMRAEIKELHQRLKTTTVYVTHDQIEAMTMADKIVVMHDGIVEQIGAPLDLYDRPANLFVAGFIGSPAMNFLKGRIDARRRAGLRHRRRPARCRSRRRPPARTGGAVIYGVRPEHLHLGRARCRLRSSWSSRPARRPTCSAELGGDRVVGVFRERISAQPGEDIRVSIDPQADRISSTPRRARASRPEGRRLRGRRLDRSEHPDETRR